MSYRDIRQTKSSPETIPKNSNQGSREITATAVSFTETGAIAHHMGAECKSAGEKSLFVLASFPPENSRIKDRKSRCRYQNNLTAAHRIFLNSPCQKSYGRKIPAKNYRYGRKILAFWYLEGDFLHSHA
jgi:hypothetical protein